MQNRYSSLRTRASCIQCLIQVCLAVAWASLVRSRSHKHACIYYVSATFGSTVLATRTVKPLKCAGTDAIQHMRVHYSFRCCCSSVQPPASQAVAPWQPDPDPAVHPKQWLSQAIGAPVSVSKLSTSNTVTICFLGYPGTLQQAKYAM